MQAREAEESKRDAAASTSAPPADDGSWTRWGLAFGLVLAVVGFYGFGLHRSLTWDFVRSHLDDWQAIARENLLLAVAAYFALYVAVTALSLPIATVLSLIGGALFGRWLGTGVVSLAATIGATLAFLSSRYVLRDWVQRNFGDRLEAINEGVEKDGAYYLFMLRLVPAVPFFLLNLGMGLTPMATPTFAVVSWFGMLLGTFLYVNVGTELALLDSPAEVLSWKIIVSLSLLGAVPLVLRKLVEWEIRVRTVGLVVAGLVLLLVGAATVRTYFRYQTADVMEIEIREFSNAEYPEDPANRSLHHGKYHGRRLTLIKKDRTHFDFVFTSEHPHVARVVFKDVDVSLYTINPPAWVKDDPGNLRIALTDREWNRQQVRFPSASIEVTGGDGWEKQNLFSAELARNCLNAGLWEVLLFTKEGNDKALYYQGWFTFPLGHYKELFEYNTGLPYWQHWYYLEHWFDPVGTPMRLDKLREVVREREVKATFDKSEKVIAAGEQARKRRTTVGENIVTWGDFYDGRKIRFASFIPPGRYSLAHPWKNEYRRIDRFDRTILRQVRSPAAEKALHELEIVFSSTRAEGRSRFLVSGIDLASVPQLPVKDYPKGMYMPMGIGVPPFMQSYEELSKTPPHRSPFFSVLLDDEDGWIDHHSFAIDGPVLHRDENDPDRLHLYLLSYERHSLVAHIVIPTQE